MAQVESGQSGTASQVEALSGFGGKKTFEDARLERSVISWRL
jgi:hypothetical protein